MKWMITIAMAAASLVVGHGTLCAAGEPQCDSAQTASAATGSTSSDDATAKKQLEARRQADAQKYQSEGANAANEACQKQAR
jgi:hypothetical protein